MPKLYVLSGPDVGKSFEVAAGAIVGRDAGCAVRLRDPSVSRHHARVEHGELGWSIVDTESRNGIRVEGQRVPSANLEDGAEFTLGEVLCRFRSEVASTTPPASGAPAPARDAAEPSTGTTVRDGGVSMRDTGAPAADARAPARDTSAPARDTARSASAPDDEAEIVLEGDWEEPSLPSVAQTTFAPHVKKSPEPALETSAAPFPPRPAVPTPAPGGARDLGATLPQRAESPGTERHVGVAHRSGGTAASSKSVLQYRRVADRPGFFNADLSQQPLWLKLALSLLALIVFAGVFWFAFMSTAFLKGKTQHETVDMPAEENG